MNIMPSVHNYAKVAWTGVAGKIVPGVFLNTIQSHRGLFQSFLLVNVVTVHTNDDPICGNPYSSNQKYC